MTFYMIILFAFLNAADAWTTWQTLRFGGFERNDVVVWLMLHMGRYNALLLIKVLPVAVVWALHYWYGIDWRVMALINAGYAWQAMHNWIALQRQKER